MKLIYRLILSLPLMAVAGFCLFGFVATFEPMPRLEQWSWRAGYLVAGGGSVFAICWIWLSRQCLNEDTAPGSSSRTPPREPSQSEKSGPASTRH
jgi:hypothetical protein